MVRAASASRRSGAVKARLKRIAGRRWTLDKAEGDARIRRIFQALRIEVNDEFGVLDALLRQLPACLKPGGRIVYSTCSIERDENLGLVEAFLADHPELELRAIRDALPFRDHTDGAFAARIEWKSAIPAGEA